MTMTKIGDICEVLNGFAFKSENYVPSGIRIIRIANVQKGYVEDTDPAFYPEDSGGLEKYMLKSGDLLMSLTGNVGRVALLDEKFLPAALNQRVACLRMKREDVLLEYVFHFLNSDLFEQKCIASSKGVAQKNMSTEWLKDFELPVVSIEKQRYIVELLKQLKAVISNRKQQLAALDTLIKARFVELFGEPTANPMKWPVYNLLELGNCKNGMNFHYDDSGVEINCLGVGDFKDNSVIRDTAALPTVSLNEMPSQEYMLQDNDIVFVRSNGNKALVGRSVAVYPGDVPTTFSGFCIRYRLSGTVVAVPYLLQVLKTESMRKKMAGRGANIQNLNQQILGTLMIPVPPMTQQNDFAAFVAQVDKSKVVVQQALDEAQMLFDSLMQEYFG